MREVVSERVKKRGKECVGVGGGWRELKERGREKGGGGGGGDSGDIGRW